MDRIEELSFYIYCKLSIFIYHEFTFSPSSEKNRYKKTVHHKGHRHFVEMEGIEPSSKQGSHTLSTCLFLPLVFVMQQDQDHQLHPYPLKLHWQHEAAVNYS